MNRNIWAVTLVALIIAAVILKPYVGQAIEGFRSGGLSYSAYFTPWWREYAGVPIYGTSSTSFNHLMNWPYSQYWREGDNYYSWSSYWRRPHYYNYWRRPYYYRRPVHRPYTRDSITGRRMRLRKFDF